MNRTKSVSTAFQRRHVEKKSTGILNTIKEYFDVAFGFLVPDEVKEMPGHGMYFVGILANIGAAVIFSLLVWETYESTLNTVFLSPNSTSGICYPALRPLSMTVLADTFGSWQSAALFDSSRAVYSFTFQEYTVNNAGWKNTTGNLQGSMAIIGALMTNLTLPINILYWTSWTGFFDAHGSNGNTTQEFNLYGDVAIIFNRQYVHGLISNVDSDCNATSTSNFDPATYILSTEYSYKEFVSNPSCSKIINPVQVGYDGLYDGDSFVLEMDMRSLVTAMAVNQNVITLRELRGVPGSFGPYIYRGVAYVLGNYYSTRYPGMVE